MSLSNRMLIITYNMYFLLKLLAIFPVLLGQPFPGPYVFNSREFGMGVFSGMGLMESKL